MAANCERRKREMKTLIPKMLIGLGVLALLLSLNGCMTQSVIQYGKGHPEKAWINNDEMWYDKTNFTNPTPHAGYYFLVPLTAPADVVTSPFQLMWYGTLWYIAVHM
jgi:hypothetical protein